MQKIFLLLILTFAGGFAIGQTIAPGSCGLLYTYDAAGAGKESITQKVIKLWND
jgi:hypothetical protein